MIRLQIMGELAEEVFAASTVRTKPVPCPEEHKVAI
jgi:hypothetical protein